MLMNMTMMRYYENGTAVLVIPGEQEMSSVSWVLMLFYYFFHDNMNCYYSMWTITGSS